MVDEVNVSRKVRLQPRHLLTTKQKGNKGMNKIVLAVLSFLFLLVISIFVDNQLITIKKQEVMIDTLKAKNERLLNQKIVYDTISTYVFRGFIGK